MGARISGSVIVARGLTKRYGRKLAVDDLSFEVGRGKVTGFLGPVGAGKTTTLRMILGLATPTAGEATINGSRYRDLEEPLHHVGEVLETSSFHPRRTARNHLRVLAAPGGISERRVDEVLNRVGLTESVRGYSSSTSPPAASIPRGSGGSVSSYVRSRPRAAPSSSRAAPWPRWPSWPTRPS